jgi:hypothetical protein
MLGFHGGDEQEVGFVKARGITPGSESKGNKKKLKEPIPNHSGLWFFKTFGEDTTICIIAGKSNQDGCLVRERNYFLSR